MTSTFFSNLTIWIIYRKDSDFESRLSKFIPWEITLPDWVYKIEATKPCLLRYIMEDVSTKSSWHKKCTLDYSGYLRCTIAMSSCRWLLLWLLCAFLSQQILIWKHTTYTPVILACSVSSTVPQPAIISTTACEICILNISVLFRGYDHLYCICLQKRIQGYFVLLWWAEVELYHPPRANSIFNRIPCQVVPWAALIPTGVA